MCTLWIDGINGVAHHIAQNVDFAIVAAAAGLGVAQLAIWFLVRWAPGDIPRLDTHEQALARCEPFVRP